MSLPEFLRDRSPTRPPIYETVRPRLLRVPSDRSLRNLARLTVTDWANGVHPSILKELMGRLATGAPIRSRLEPKSTPGQYRTLWIPTDPVYKYVLDRLAEVLGTFSTSPETLAFRKGMGALKGLRAMLDEYEGAADKAGIPKKKNAEKEGHIIGTAYQGDIKDYYGSIRYDQVAAYLRERLTLLLGKIISPEECRELADVVANLVCPGMALPQGFATSPAIANGVGVSIDKGIRRGVRAVLGAGRVSVVGRYADDLLVFTSGEYHDRVMSVVSGVLGEQGFALHPKKTQITRAQEGKGARIEALGAVIRNDGDGPLSFGPRPRYVHQVRDAAEFLLESADVDSQHVSQVMGGIGYINETIHQGLPARARLRDDQKSLLPRDLERVWHELRTKLQRTLSPRQMSVFDFRRGEKKLERTISPLSFEEVFEKLGIVLTLNLPQGAGEAGSFSLRDEDRPDEQPLTASRETLMAEGFPAEADDIESFLYQNVEKQLQAKCDAFFEAIGEASMNFGDLRFGNPEAYKQFREIFAEFAKWHLCAVANVPGLTKEQMSQFVDDDTCAGFLAEGGTPQFTHSVPDGVFPWGLQALWESFLGRCGKQFTKWGELAMYQKIFTLPRINKVRSREYRYYPRDREGRRNGRGGFMHLPGYRLKTHGGLPTAVQSRRRRKKVDTDEDIPPTTPGPLDDPFLRSGS